MKKIIGIVITLLTVTFMIGGVPHKSPQKPPKVSIVIGATKMGYITTKDKWEGAVYKRGDTFETMLKNSTDVKFPHIGIGETAVISFENYAPDKLIISDILIDKNGHQIYPDKTITNIPVELKGGKCSFKIEKNMASALSSSWRENKIDIRGFRMTALWGKNQCEYSFIIRTDAY